MMDKNNKRAARTPKRDLPLLAAIAAAVGVLVLVAIPIVYSTFYTNRWNAFKERLAASSLQARRHGGSEALIDGEERLLDPDSLSRIYALLLDAGMGREMDERPDGEAPMQIGFDNGARLLLWDVRLDDPQAQNENGLFVCYEEADGYAYLYDSDRIDLAAVKAQVRP